MPTVVFKLFAKQGAGGTDRWMDNRTEKAAERLYASSFGEHKNLLSSKVIYVYRLHVCIF